MKTKNLIGMASLLCLAISEPLRAQINVQSDGAVSMWKHPSIFPIPQILAK